MLVFKVCDYYSDKNPVDEGWCAVSENEMMPKIFICGHCQRIINNYDFQQNNFNIPDAEFKDFGCSKQYCLPDDRDHRFQPDKILNNDPALNYFRKIFDFVPMYIEPKVANTRGASLSQDCLKNLKNHMN